MAERKKKNLAGASPKLRTRFVSASETSFEGYAVDEADLTRRFVIELLVDGYPFRLTRADAYVDELARAGTGDGCYGFSFVIPQWVLGDGSVVEARLANDGAVIGSPIALDAPASETADPRESGTVQGLGGLRFEGWCGADQDAIPTITAMIDGEPVAQAQAARWTHVGSAGNAKAVRGFDLHLPQRFADGRVRRVHFVRDDGQELPSSPLTFVAYADGLKETLMRLGTLESERLRAEQLDRILPMAIPFAQYPQWKLQFPVPAEKNGDAAAAIVLIGPGHEKDSLRSLEAQGYPDWVAAALPEAQAQTAFEPGLLRTFLRDDAKHCDIVLFALAGTRFAGNSIQRFVDAFAAFPDAVAAYGDLEFESEDASSWPLAFPAFDYERMLEQGYCAHLFALRREAAEQALDAGASDLYRLFNAMLDEDRAVARKVVHVPGDPSTLPPLDVASASRVLAAASAAHLEARGTPAKTAPGAGTMLPAVHVQRTAERSSITVVIPVRNKPALLRACLKSIRRAVSAARARILIVDNDSSDPQMLQYLDELQERSATVLRVPGAFNFSRLNNIAAEKADTEFLCLLNNDIEALDDVWLRELTGRIAEPDVGAVGALLLWPSGIVQHGGVVLGPSFAATHVFNDRIQNDPGYADLLRAAHEASAVTAACLLTRRSDYLELGGMDELRFSVNFNDVDYCLRLRAAGKRVVFTPHARLLHRESASRGADVAADRAGRFERELRTLRARWGEALIGDPYYSPMLSLDGIPFSALAWPPRPMQPRLNEPPAAVEIPPSF